MVKFLKYKMTLTFMQVCSRVTLHKNITIVDIQAEQPFIKQSLINIVYVYFANKHQNA